MALHEAFFYSRDKSDVVCGLCAQQCRIHPGRKGKCGVRINLKGTLYSLVYGELVARHIDPIEKKPLFHVLPGSRSLSISTMGCNFRCLHCQNYSISQVAGLSPSQLTGRTASPQEVVADAKKNHCESISYTYVEPTIFYEFAYDCAVEADSQGIKNIFVSNGYLSPEATRKIAPLLGAINIDIKSYRNNFYKKICGAKLKPVLECVSLMKELGVWVEVTTLIIPGLNDSDEELNDIASFLASIDPGIPWHVTAFHPMHKMTDRSPTPLESLQRARRIGLDAGLFFVYEGNVPGTGNENTYCPNCGGVVIERYGFSIRTNSLSQGKCSNCETAVPGLWK